MFHAVKFETEISDGIVQYYCDKNDIEWKYSNGKLILNLSEDKTYRDNEINEMNYILKSYLNKGYFSVLKENIDKVNELLLLWDGEIIWDNSGACTFDHSPCFVVGKIKMCKYIANMKCYFMTNADKWINKTIGYIENDKLPLVFLKNNYPNFENILVEYSLSVYGEEFFIEKICENTYLVELIGLHDIYNIYEKYSTNKVSINFSNQPYLISEYLIGAVQGKDLSLNIEDILGLTDDTNENSYLVKKSQYKFEDNCDLIWCQLIEKYFHSKSVF